MGILDKTERSVAGAVLVDPTVFSRVQLSHSHFSSEEVRAVWEAMGRLHDRSDPIDILSLSREMGDDLTACGGMPFLSGLAMESAHPHTLDHHSGIIRDGYLRRSVLASARDILSSGDGESGEDLLSKLAMSSDALQSSLSRQEHTLGMVVGEEIGRALRGSGAALGIPTGLGIDRMFPGGLPKSKITTLFADTGSFKTTAVNQLLFNAAELGFKGLLVPLEDSDELTAHRWMSRKTGINYGRIAGGICNDAERQLIAKLTPGDWKHLENIKSCDGIEPNIDHIIREVASAKAQGRLDFVVVDYIQLLEGRGNHADVLTNAMRRAANAAKRYEVCWIFLSQANDRNDDRKDPRPSLKDMFGSAAMKQMSKTVLALFKPHEHWPSPLENDKHPQWGMYSRLYAKNPKAHLMYPNLIELWCLKNVLGRKKAMQAIVVNPELGILDPIPLKEMI